MLKRTNTSDSDDDEEILRQQAEFYKQKAQKKVIPAATVIKSTGDTTIREQDGSLEKMEVDNQETITEENIQDQIANTFEAIPNNIELKQIAERQEGARQIRPMKFDSDGFPKAVRRDLDIQPKKGSIFAQHIKRLKKNSGDVPDQPSKNISLFVKEKDLHGNIKTIEVPGNHDGLETIATAAQRSSILTPSDRQSIHTKNLETINSMSQEDILAEREKLLATLDPALVQFLRSRRSATKEDQETRNRTIAEQNKAAATVSIEQLEVPKELLSIPEANSWLNFSKFEAHKLAWMKDVSVEDLKKTDGFEARFDFHGNLLPYSVEQIDDRNRHLYHHGAEPERPGYSLQELLLLTRSNVIQQRVVALNTLGNILSLDQTGIYDKVIDIPLEQIFFVLRICLDDNTPSVLTAAIKALRNLVYFQIDETCLDNMMSFGIGLVQPILEVDNEPEDDNTVNDQQLAETNLIKCLARTDILTRIRYIVNSIKPPPETIIYCMEILTRLSRDCEYIIEKILQCEGLLGSLIKYFLPRPEEMRSNKEAVGYFSPYPQMVKLLRILSSRSRNIAVTLLKKYELFRIIVSYLYEDYFSQNTFGLRLQVECMHYWSSLLHYGLIEDSIGQHENLLFKLLDYHLQNTNNVITTTLIRQNHVSSLLILLSKTVEKSHNLFPNLLKDCCGKWMTQFMGFEQFKCSHSQITSAILYLAAVCNRYGIRICSSDLLLRVLESNAFKLATNNITNGSLLLNNYETHKTTANLKSLEAATWFSMDHIVPVMQTNSCIPLIYALSSYVLSDNDTKVKMAFLSHPNISLYIEQLKDAKRYFNVGNWFTRCESFVIMQILKIAQNVQDRIDSAPYYKIAVRGLCIFSAEQKADINYVLERIVFCPRFYSVDVAMANTKLSERNDILDTAWKHLVDIKGVYADVLGISTNLHTFETSLALNMSVGNMIPVDWIYTPLVLLYSNQEKKSKDQVSDECREFHIILNCLRWILICETSFEDLARSISPTEKYVRLGCLFLGSDSLFLHTELQDLITRVYKFLVKNENEINFEQEISGLTNFKDFFVQLLEQYQGVSYGNKVFGNVLLFPLMKRHDVKYRKTLWSEYFGVVETFTVTRNEVWLNPDDLIRPVDTDVSLCSSYYKSIRHDNMPKHTIMYEIAMASVQEFMKKQDEKH